MKTKTKKFKCWMVFDGFYEDNKKGIALLYKTKKGALESVKKMDSVTPYIIPEKTKIFQVQEV